MLSLDFKEKLWKFYSRKNTDIIIIMVSIMLAN